MYKTLNEEYRSTFSYTEYYRIHVVIESRTYYITVKYLQNEQHRSFLER